MQTFISLCQNNLFKSGKRKPEVATGKAENRFNSILNIPVHGLSNACKEA
jgi:hypothetical protein